MFATAADDYLAGAGEFREHAAANMVGARFMVDFYALVLDWTEWASDVMATWPDEPKDAQPNWQLMEQISERARRG